MSKGEDSKKAEKKAHVKTPNEKKQIMVSGFAGSKITTLPDLLRLKTRRYFSGGSFL